MEAEFGYLAVPANLLRERAAVSFPSPTENLSIGRNLNEAHASILEVAEFYQMESIAKMTVRVTLATIYTSTNME